MVKKLLTLRYFFKARFDNANHQYAANDKAGAKAYIGLSA
jgi:hypothetical protein